MPKKGGKRKKRRTHVPVLEAQTKMNVPKSFVLQTPNSTLSRPVLELLDDFKNVMKPYTAVKLTVKKNNSIKDFVNVSGTFGVTHLVLFSQTEKHTNIRIACVPRGPTLSYRVTKYALGKDVRSLQKNPVDVVAAFKSSPLVVLNNFSKDVSHQKLAATTFQNMFPAINIQSIKLKDCRRVVLYNYNPETDEIEFRHYAVRAAPTGLNKSVKKLIQAKVPNLGNAEDIADIILGGGVGGGGGGGDAYASDSDFEDEESHVVLPDNYVGKGNKKSNKSAIKLAELGPRMTLKLVKVQDEVCAGDVLYHAFETKDSSEAAIIKEKVASKKAKKEERIAIQTANVLKKKQALEEKLAKKREKRKLNLDNDGEEGEEEEEEEEEDGDDDDDDDDDDAGEGEDEDEEGAPVVVPGEEEEDDDLEWYRQETGSEPDDVMKLAAKYKRQQALENAEKKALEEKNGPVKKRPRVQFDDDSKDDGKKGKGKGKGKGEKKRQDTPGPKGWSRTKSIGGVKRKEGGLFGSKEGASKKPRHH